jgi:opacity protein-like surface antigen
MMKKLYIAAFSLAVSLPIAAQDTYESARLLGSDLNGTARYVAMGGAMDALGADISTISSNPAGIGLFRHSNASVSLGFVTQQDAREFDGKKKTTMSFDQAGFVYSTRLSRTSFVNFAFNFHKSRNFNQILSAANSLKECSQNGLTYDKALENDYYFDTNRQDEAIGYYSSGEVSWAYSQSDYINANVLMADVETHLKDKSADWIFYNDANAYTFDRAHRGWINNFDFNISGNVNDRFYWGFTVGVKDVRYRGYSEYGESLVDLVDQPVGSVVTGDERKITGTGLDVTAGVIIRPIEDSPFRFGFSIATPTWYDLTSKNDTHMMNNSEVGYWDKGHSSNDYDFKFYTPWKFGVSLGHTISNQVALGLGYEYSDFSTATNRVNKGASYWYEDYGYSPSYTDEAMKRNTEKSLKGVHTLKAGVEVKPIPEFAVRVGYNYLSSPYEESGVRDMRLESPGVAYSSTTDYVNWKDTHRFTCGVGVKLNAVNIDLAYQYSGTKGDFHPFQPYEGNTGVTEVKNYRHQVLLTLGYTF